MSFALGLLGTGIAIVIAMYICLDDQSEIEQENDE